MVPVLGRYLDWAFWTRRMWYVPVVWGHLVVLYVKGSEHGPLICALTIFFLAYVGLKHMGPYWYMVYHGSI